MTKELDLDWYTYLTEDFKRHRESYRTAEKAVFDCPKCGGTDVVRIGHVKAKIKKIGYYECSTCRNKPSIENARKICKEKYGGKNPFQVESIQKKIKETLFKNHGVTCALKIKEVHDKGITKAAELKKQKRKYEADFSKITVSVAVDKKEWYRQYYRIRENSDPGGIPRRMIYGALCRMLKGQKKMSKTNILKDIGYTPQQLRDHIESLFKPGMTWENWGEWHLDHIKPITLFDVTDPEEIKKANALENLQPLWASDNIRKGNKY